MAIDFIAALRTEGSALASAAEAGPLVTAVPSCPGWTLADLVGHTGRIHRWATVAATAGGEPAGRLPKAPDDLTQLLSWYDEGLEGLVAALQATPADAPAWNFAGYRPATAAFWQRRQAQETAVHRWDGEAARGNASPIEATLASDGIDELMEFFSARRAASVDGGITTGGTIHVHCQDTPGEWTFSCSGADFTMSRGHIKGDVALRGTASDLLLALWGRLGLDSLDVVGDRAVAERWLAPGMI